MQHTDRWRKVKAQAFRRDMARLAPCWICGQPIDYTLPSTNPDGSTNVDAYEADHYKPRRRYPELAYDITNLLPSHVSCNRSRGDAEPERGIGTPSREW